MPTIQEAEDLLAFAKKVLVQAKNNKRSKEVIKVLERNVKTAKATLKATRKSK